MALGYSTALEVVLVQALKHPATMVADMSLATLGFNILLPVMAILWNNFLVQWNAHLLNLVINGVILNGHLRVKTMAGHVRL